MTVTDGFTGFLGTASPWGILRGVRPAKLVHHLLDQGFSPGVIVDRLAEEYGVCGDKARLITAIACRQRPFLPVAGPDSGLVAVYIGVPFCPTRCLYCSFPANVLPPPGPGLSRALYALTSDLAAAAQHLAELGLRAQTVYLGGGTPTSLGTGDFETLLTEVRDRFVGPETLEFTVEAGRPDCSGSAGGRGRPQAPMAKPLA